MGLGDFLSRVGSMLDDTAKTYKFGSDWRDQESWLQGMNALKKQREEAEIARTQSAQALAEQQARRLANSDVFKILADQGAATGIQIASGMTPERMAKGEAFDFSNVGEIPAGLLEGSSFTPEQAAAIMRGNVGRSAEGYRKQSVAAWQASERQRLLDEARRRADADRDKRTEALFASLGIARNRENRLAEGGQADDAVADMEWAREQASKELGYGATTEEISRREAELLARRSQTRREQDPAYRAGQDQKFYQGFDAGLMLQRLEDEPDTMITVGKDPRTGRPRRVAFSSLSEKDKETVRAALKSTAGGL